jgi:type IV secretion system protein VirB10
MEDNKEEKKEEDVSQPLIGSISERFKQMSSARKIAMVAFAVLMLSVMVFIIFFSSSNSSKPVKPIDTKQPIDDAPPIEVTQPKQNVYNQQESEQLSAINKVSSKIAELKPPTPPSLEKIEEPVTPPQILPVQPQQVTQPQLPLTTSKNKGEKSENNIKKASNIIAFGGGKDDKASEGKQNKDEFLGFDGGMIDNVSLKPSQAQSVVATKISNDLKYMIVQGKIIDAVLETAINTQMSSGVIRAVISRDVYGEQGDLVLIPKGSRLIGKYGASTGTSGDGGNVITRVYASWNRIITPSGIDVALPETPAADTLGRNGIPGYLDTNLSNNLFNAFLVSILGPYIVAQASGQGSKNVNSGSSDNKDDSSDSSSNLQVDLATQILSQGIKDFQGIANDQINKIYPPGLVTNFIDQGTRIDIIVQQDILFPKQAIQLNTGNLP